MDGYLDKYGGSVVATAAVHYINFFLGFFLLLCSRKNTAY